MLSTPYFCNFSVILLIRVFAKFASYNFAQKKMPRQALLNKAFVKLKRPCV